MKLFDILSPQMRPGLSLVQAGSWLRLQWPVWTLVPGMLRMWWWGHWAHWRGRDHAGRGAEPHCHYSWCVLPATGLGLGSRPAAAHTSASPATDIPFPEHNVVMMAPMLPISGQGTHRVNTRPSRTPLTHLHTCMLWILENISKYYKNYIYTSDPKLNALSYLIYELCDGRPNIPEHHRTSGHYDLYRDAIAAKIQLSRYLICYLFLQE